MIDRSSGNAGIETLLAPDGPFFVIAGPCVLEDDALNVGVGECLAGIADALDVPIVFKASFDKANRSRLRSPRGPGMDEGLRSLERVREATGLPVITDVHEIGQATAAAQVCDVLQIPAFLCRQTDLLRAAGATGRGVNIKKGQWMAPEEMAGAVEKVRAEQKGRGGVVVTERGTFYGYGDLVVDMRSFIRMSRATSARVVFDGTHSVQRPGLGPGVSGGDREFIAPLARAAVAAGAGALFMEVHPAPENAPSDSTNMLRLDSFRPLLETVLELRSVLDGRWAIDG